jgi:Potential Queuosine, Q, salvage protein family
MFFKDQDPDRFNFADIKELTIFSDNVIPTMLEHLKVISLPDSLQQKIEAGQELTTEEAYLTRAAAVVACERIVQKAHSQGTIPHMTEGELDVYLWRLGKEGDYRKIVRLQLQDTVMF